MRLVLVISLVCMMQSFALDSYTQNSKISLSVKEMRLDDILMQIENETKYRFAYNKTDIDVDQVYTIDIHEAEIKDVLNQLFADKKINYSVVDRQIILSKPEGSFAVSRQSLTVSGKVTDSSGSLLPGVTIVVKKTTQGTVTDSKGNYSITNVPGNATLVFSFVGMRTQEVVVGSQTRIDVAMEEETVGIEEVVAVGYGTQKKVNLTGSVSSIRANDIINKPVTQTSQALQGIAPGVTITQESGLPGEDAGQIRIRGIGSISAGQSPLVLIDNIQMSLNAINPNNIESISILKDAAAASIYGSRAANGVIIITTKRGKKGDVNIQYDTYTGIQRATNFPEKVNALDHMIMYDIALQNEGKSPVFVDQINDYKQYGPDNFSRFNTDWKDLVLSNNGLVHNHNLNLSTGTDKVHFFAAGSYLDQNGLTPNTNFKRFDFRFNTDVEIFSNLSASMNVVISNSDTQYPFLSPYTIMSHTVGLPAYLPGKFDTGEYGEAWNNFNPIAMAEAGGFNDSQSKANVLSGTLKYYPVKNLELLATYSTSKSNSVTRAMQKQYQVFYPDEVNNVLVAGPLYPGSNSLDESWGQYVRNEVISQLTYNKKIKKHNLKFILGYSAEEYRATNIGASRQNFMNQEMPYLDSGDAGTMTNSGGIGESSLMSFFSRVNYDFDNKYLLELNGRYDGSSRFAKSNRWGFFPSTSVGWRISEEPFWEDIKEVVGNLKLRASYGILGNQNLTSNYPTVATFALGEQYNYFFDNKIVSGYAISQAANPEIKWESSSQFDVGLDISLFNNKLELTADYYERRIYDMLQTLPIPLLVGLGAPYVNAGSMKNKGWELSVGWRDKKNDFEYGILFNLSDVKNKVADLRGEEYINGLTIIREGYPINSYYGYIAEGLFNSPEEVESAPYHFATTQPGDIRYKDVNGPEGVPDELIDSYDRVVLGNSFPHYEFSLNMDLTWKGFDVQLYLQGIGKRDNYMSDIGAWAFHSVNYQGSAYEYHKDYWTEDNPDASYPRLTVQLDNNKKVSSYWIKSGAYLRLKNATIGYTLPASLTNKINIGSLRFFLSGQNLLTFDNFYPGFDPEKSDNTGQFYPIMKTYTLGLTLKL